MYLIRLLIIAYFKYRGYQTDSNRSYNFIKFLEEKEKL